MDTRAPTSHLRSLVLGRAFGIELPFVVLGPIAYGMLVRPTGAEALHLTVAAVLLQLLKTAIIAPWLWRDLGALSDVERALADAPAIDDEALQRAGRRAEWLPLRVASGWALAWVGFFAGCAVVAARLEFRAADDLGFWSTSLLAALAAGCAAYPLLFSVLADALVPFTTKLSMARLSRGENEPRKTWSLRSALIAWALCLAVAPTAWMSAVATSARFDRVTLFFFAFVAVVWAPLCAFYLARAWAAPVRAINQAIAEIIVKGEVREIAYVPVLRGDELGQLANAVNAMIRRLAESNRRTDESIRERERQVEQTQAALRARDEFMSLAAHELRTPLTSLLLQLNAVERALVEQRAPGVEGIRRSERRVKQLSSIISDLLDVSGLHAGKFEMNYRPFDLEAMVREVADGFADFSARHSLRVEVGGALPEITADQARLEQVISNLIENAIKYSPDGGAVRVRIDAFEDGGRISVTDQGLGIEPEALPHLFDRFYRGEPARRRFIRGLGLGLYLSRQIVEHHAGRIWVESEVGRGSTFYVWLPLQPPA